MPSESEQIREQTQTEQAKEELKTALEYCRDDYPRGNVEAAVARAYEALGGDLDDVF